MTRIIYSDIQGILNAVKTNPSEDLESEVIEFKGYRNERALHNAKDLAEEISAFANHKGGYVIIGVKDSSDVTYGQWEEQLVGINDVDLITTKERIRGKLQPEIDIEISEIPFEGKTYVIMYAPHRPDTLVSTKSGKTCIRDGRSSRPMTPYEIQKAVKSLTTYDWSAEVIPDVNIYEVLDTKALVEAIQDFVNRLKLEETPKPESYLESISATKQGHLTHGGLIFLGKEDQIKKYLGDYEYRFTWKTRSGELIINDVWNGCIWNAINITKTHFDECNRYAEFKYKDRTFSAPLLDDRVFHEAYLNAVVHRDYSAEGMVSVNFIGDQLKITSPGLFYGGVTAENIARHEPRHRNKNLANILMVHRKVDRAGMGVLRMGIHSLMYGRAFPVFKEDSESVEVTLQAEYFRSPITILSHDNLGKWGMSELFILNSVYETGVVAIEEIEKRLTKISDTPFQEVLDAVDQIRQVELCGTKQGLFVRVVRSWKDFMDVGKIFRVPTSSEKHVNLYKYLKKHKEAANADLTEVLGHKYSSQTSKFLREAEYVKRRGSGANAIWYITHEMNSQKIPNKSKHQ